MLRALQAQGGPRPDAVDAGLQRLLAGLRLDGSLADGDYVAVHALNRNRSRVDLFQRRLVRQVVRLAGDGSAEVSRVVKVINAVPAGEPVQAGVAAGPGSAPGWTVRGDTATLARAFVDPLAVALDLHG